MKKCLTCKFMKADSMFGPGVVKCTDCRNQHKRETEAAMRIAVLGLLGGACACCGITETVFLDLDHIAGDGAAERARVNSATWRLALREPERFRILCRNCNWAVYLGKCPHEA